MTSKELIATLNNHYDQLYHNAYDICGSFFDVENALQTACLKAWEHHPKTNLYTSCLAWMATIVRHESITILRKRRHEAACGLLGRSAIDAASLEDEIGHWEILAKVNTLSPADRETFLLRYEEGYPVEEIDRRLRKPRSTVSRMLQRARNTLAASLRTD